MRSPDAVEYAQEIILDLILPHGRERKETVTRARFRDLLQKGKLDDKVVEMPDPNVAPEFEDAISEEGSKDVMGSKVEIYPGATWEIWLKSAYQSACALRQGRERYIRISVGEARRRLAAKFLRERGNAEFEYFDPSQLSLPTQDLIVVERSLVEFLRKNPNDLYQLTHHEFEEAICELFGKLGYTVSLTAKTRDGGCDLIAFHKDPLGIGSKYIVEAKHYKPTNKVGVDIIRQVAAVRHKHGAQHGIIVTSSYFTADAVKENHAYYGLELSDFDRLVSWINRPHPNPAVNADAAR